MNFKYLSCVTKVSNDAFVLLEIKYIDSGRGYIIYAGHYNYLREILFTKTKLT